MQEFHRTALRVSFVNLLLNALLAILKLTAGSIVGSEALLSDGLHSVADVFSTVIVMIGVRLSARCSDHKHPYGHERLECVAAVVLAVIVGATGIGIAVAAFRTILTAKAVTTAITAPTLIVPLAAIAMKEGMFRYTRRAARKIGSSALLADAWHQRADALSSIGGFVGVCGAYMGIPVLDSVAGAVIGAMILKAALEIFSDAMKKMTDRSCEEELQEKIRCAIAACQGVRRVENLRTRLFGSRVYAEVTVAVDGTLSAKEAYAIASHIRQTVDDAFETVKDCAVHIRPL